MEPEPDQDFLRAVPIFSRLEERHLARLASHATPVTVAAGDLLFSAGDPGDALYIVRSGRVEVEAQDGAVIRELSRGAVLGELALLSGSARSASARARRDSELLRVGREAFLESLEDSAGFAQALTRALGAQLQESRGLVVAPSSRPRVIAVVALTEGIDADAFADDLLAALARLDAPARLPRRGGRPPREGHAALLDAAEREHDQVVLVAGGPARDEWAEFCLRQADRVLGLADAGRRAPRPGVPSGWDLVVTAGDGRLREWVASTEPRALHRVGPGHAGGIDRLARRLTGRSLGLVLSGGGARGFAHLGVLEELEAADVAVDRVAGCSMGAYVAAQHALGRPASEIAALCRKEFVERNPLGDYTLPVVALVRGRRAMRMLRRSFGDAAVEDLEREFFCVSCDMLTGELVVHRQGPLVGAVGASMCLPGIVPPVALDSRLLLDGGVLNNLPVEQMAASGEGPVLAVDVTVRFEAPAAPVRGRPRADGALWALRRLITGVEGVRPRLAETITRSIMLGSIDTAEAAGRYATWTIAPRVEGVGMLAFEHIDAVREAGRQAAREFLARKPLPAQGADGRRC